VRKSSVAGLICLVAAGNARAQAPAPPQPYSLPWQLRPALAVSVARFDTSIGLRDEKGKDGVAAVSTLLLGYKATPWFMPLVRVGFVGNYPSTPDTSATAFLNLVVGANFSIKLPRDFRLALFLGGAFPTAQGGGDQPDPKHAAALRAGILNRSALDNAMFASNDVVIFSGVALAYISGGLTAQVEATVLQLIRVRGANVQPDALKTNSTSGLHIGYFVIPQLSFAAELRYQRWLSTPKAVADDPTGTTRDNLSLAVGLRAHVKLGKRVFVRPGLAIAAGLDDPMAAQSYKIVQIDVPILF
jgi:hypothetical protein